jgi:hypothetical protein
VGKRTEVEYVGSTRRRREEEKDLLRRLGGGASGVATLSQAGQGRREGVSQLGLAEVFRLLDPTSTSSAWLERAFCSLEMSLQNSQDRLLHRKTATAASSAFASVPLSPRDADPRLDKRDDDFRTTPSSSKSAPLLDKVRCNTSQSEPSERRTQQRRGAYPGGLSQLTGALAAFRRGLRKMSR